jgi:hypothetical protein
VSIFFFLVTPSEHTPGQEVGFQSEVLWALLTAKYIPSLRIHRRQTSKKSAFYDSKMLYATSSVVPNPTTTAGEGTDTLGAFALCFCTRELPTHQS